MALRIDDVPLEDLSDDELAARFQQGDAGAVHVLLERYRRFARSKARDYFLVGADVDDIEQEGLIGLYKAARDFRPDRQASFRAFAEVCVTRQVITAVKTATRRKHQPLNRYVSFSASRVAEEWGERSVEELLEAHAAADPAEELVGREQVDLTRRALAQLLSDLEVEVLRLYVEGKSYQEIGEDLGRQSKSIDNALQRIKRKLEGHLSERRCAERELVLA